MEDRRPPEYHIDLFADKACAKAVVKGMCLSAGSSLLV